METNNSYQTETRDIYRNGIYLGNIIISKYAMLSEEEYDDLINQTFPEIKQKPQ